MNDAKILELALSAGFETDCKNFAAFDGVECKDELLAFARLVAAAERERAACIVERFGRDIAFMPPLDEMKRAHSMMANAIRSRTE